MDQPTTVKPSLLVRITQFAPLRLLVLGGILFLFMGVSSGVMEKFAGQPVLATVAAAVMAGLGVAIYAAFVRLIERRPVSELSLAPLVRELGIGLLIGAGLYTASVLVLMALGIYRIVGFNPVSFMVPAIGMALSSGFFEELLFRGALFRIVEEMFGSWISLVVSSLVFGLLHLLNPAATLTGAIFISIEAGVLLAAGYMVTRRLWLSIGFHVAWNYTQQGVFSGIVSGNAPVPGLIKPIIQGPDALTGGSFGLESSLVAFLFCTTAGVILLILSVRRGNVVAPFWKRRTTAS
ncbi:CPBP family intramembrane glutamic endopeptidase [Novosphingobium sp. FKTRR1]|uniref:CPBP family intramembrane glutamic endopeptidase n=1 Tax=Novosphingobium sp. FKTRR1 TaxID=2879118 RepID=UPI001CF00AE3|nr:type II CAAX endopeptidase family protein [Novosphingobium sp. FKTRR1]